MPQWSRNKVNSSNINSGNEYTTDDQVSIENLNAMVNSGLYSQDFAEHLADTPDTSQAGQIGTPTVQLVDNVVGGKTYKKFKFANLKGATGAAIVNTVLQGQDAQGGNIYKQTFDNGSTATFTAPKGAKGDKGASSIVVDTFTSISDFKNKIRNIGTIMVIGACFFNNECSAEIHSDIISSSGTVTSDHTTSGIISKGDLDFVYLKLRADNINEIEFYNDEYNLKLESTYATMYCKRIGINDNHNTVILTALASRMTFTEMALIYFG